MPYRIHIITVILATLLPRAASADTAQDLAKLRTTFDAEIAKSGEPQIRIYLAQLENLERTLVTAGDYTGAIRARDEAADLRRQLAASGNSPSTGAPVAPNTETPDKILLLPKDALAIGTIWDKEGDCLHGWRSKSEVARWQLPNLPPGGYEVILEFHAATSEGGDFVLSEAFFQLSGKIAPTAGETKKENVGTLKIRSGQGFLSLYATRTELGGLMRLKSIELVPAWR